MNEEWVWGFDEVKEMVMHDDPFREIVSKFTKGYWEDHDAQCDQIEFRNGRLYLHNALDGKWWYIRRKESK